MASTPAATAAGINLFCTSSTTRFQPYCHEQAVETELSNVLDFLKSKNDYKNHILIEKEVKTWFDDNTIISTTITCCNENKEREEVKIDDALTSLRSLTDFYYGQKNNTVLYNSLLEIEINLQEKYCAKKCRQYKITECFQ